MRPWRRDDPFAYPRMDRYTRLSEVLEACELAHAGNDTGGTEVLSRTSSGRVGTKIVRRINNLEGKWVESLFNASTLSKILLNNTRHASPRKRTRAGFLLPARGRE